MQLRAYNLRNWADFIFEHLPISPCCLTDVKPNRSMTIFRPHHLKYVPEVASKHPQVKFVINHIAKPLVGEGRMDGWRDEMAEIAKHPNVYCKISGLLSEREPGSWSKEEYEPYIQHILDCFTADRCMYGSDWPVFGLVNVTYRQNFDFIETLLSRLSDSDKEKVFRDNAVKVYNLDLAS